MSTISFSWSCIDDNTIYTCNVPLFMIFMRRQLIDHRFTGNGAVGARKDRFHMTDVINIVYLLVILLLIALFVIILSIRLTIPYTLGLVIVGFVISFIPALPRVRLDPALVIFVFLPALLFEGSWSISIKLLWKHWLTIFLLVGPGFVLSLVIIAI